MKPEIKERIEKIRKGEVPEGFKTSHIKECCEILDNQRVPIKDSERILGTIPYYGATGIQGYVDNYIFNEDLLLVGEDGADWSPFGKTAYIIRGKSWVNNHAHVLRAININLYYLKEYLVTSDLRKYVNGSTRGKLNLNNLEKIPILHPEYTEQSKIVKILSTWDKAIELKEKLIEEKKELKRGLTQKLLVGKLRFKEHVKNPNLHEVKKYSILPEEWGIKKASSIFSNLSKKNNGNEQLLSATQNNGVIPRDMLDGDVMSPSGDTKSYKLVEEGDFVISLRSFQGGIEYSCYQGIISPAYTVLKNKIPICKDFYRHLFKSRLFIDRLASSVIGIRDGKQISYNDFSFMLLPYPELKEQEKIADMLNNIDNIIEILKSELNQLKEQKRGLMQLLLTGIVRVEMN